MLVVAVAALARTQARRTRRRDDRICCRIAWCSAACASELQALQRDTRAGWTQESVARGLTASRIVASYLAGHAVSQRPIDVERQRRRAAGRMAASLSRRKVAVSGATTAMSLTPAWLHGHARPRRRRTSTPRSSSLTRARYGRIDTLDGSSLDDALATASRAADRVASRHTCDRRDDRDHRPRAERLEAEGMGTLNQLGEQLIDASRRSARAAPAESDLRSGEHGTSRRHRAAPASPCSC